MKGDKLINVAITPGTIITALLVIVLAAVLYLLRDLILIVLTAIVIASSIEPAVAAMEMRKMPRVVGVMIMYFAISVLLGGLIYMLLPPLLTEASGFVTALPGLIEGFDLQAQIQGGFGIGQSLLGGGASFSDLIVNLNNAFSGTAGGVVQAAASVFGGLFSLILTIILSFYFAVQSTGIDDFLRVITPLKQQAYVVGLWRRSQHKIGRWMQGQLILSFLVGILVYLGLSILGIHYAFLLAVIAAVLELVPVFGSILAAIPAAAIAFMQGDTALMLVVIGLYVIINQFQGNLFYPLVVKKIVGVPPLVVILALIAGAQLAGFLGIILSVPIAAALQEFVNDVQKKRDGAVAA